MEPNLSKRGPGRPRSFDELTALDAAMRCFWSRGYDGASIGLLCESMNMPRASLYARFGDKEGLFEAAINHYGETQSKAVLANLSATGDAETELSAFFDGMISLVTQDAKTLGCLVANVLSDIAGSNERFRALLAEKTETLEDLFFATLLVDNPLGNQEDLRSKAMMLSAVTRGLAVAARAGQNPARLARTARVAIEVTCASAQSH